MERAIDNRKARSEATKRALMRATEKLVAKQGVENVSIREIVATAGQKNESVLQYHFGTLTGLLGAIRQERSQEIQAKRASLLEATLEKVAEPSLSQLCSLMVEPTFELARKSADFRHYMKAFGHEPALSDTSPLKKVSRKGAGGESGYQLGLLLKKTLPHLDEKDYRQRMEAAVMLCSTAMYHQARQKNAFRGQQSKYFLSSLLDALSGLLAAPVSPNTQSLK